MLNAGTGVVGGVQEDALMAIGTLVEGKLMCITAFSSRDKKDHVNLCGQC